MADPLNEELAPPRRSGKQAFFTHMGGLYSAKNLLQIRLKAAIKATIGYVPRYIQKVEKECLAGSGSALKARLSGFASFNVEETQNLLSYFGFHPDLMQGKRDIFGNSIQDGMPLVPLFFSKGCPVSGRNLDAFLRRLPMEGDIPELLVTLTQQAVPHREDAENILYGTAPLPRWALKELLEATHKLGFSLLEQDILNPQLDATQTTLETGVETPEHEEENTMSEEPVKETTTERLWDIVTAHCGTCKGYWDDLSFEIDVPDLKALADKNAMLPHEAIGRLVRLLLLPDGFMKGRTDVMDRPRQGRLPAVPNFYLIGDPRVGERIQTLLSTLVPQILPEEALKALYKEEFADPAYAHEVFAGRQPMSRRSLLSLVRMWNDMEPRVHVMREDHLIYSGGIPKQEMFGKPLPVQIPVLDVHHEEALEPPPHEPLDEPVSPLVVQDASPPVDLPPVGLTEEAALVFLATYANEHRKVFRDVAFALLDATHKGRRLFIDALMACGEIKNESSMYNILRGVSFWNVRRMNALLTAVSVTALDLYTQLKETRRSLQAQDMPAEPSDDTREMVDTSTAPSDGVPDEGGEADSSSEPLPEEEPLLDEAVPLADGTLLHGEEEACDMTAVPVLSAVEPVEDLTLVPPIADVAAAPEKTDLPSQTGDEPIEEVMLRYIQERLATLKHDETGLAYLNRLARVMDALTR